MIRNYEQLSAEEQKQAVEKHLDIIINAIINGEIRFDDSVNEDKLQEHIDAAMEESERLNTPWFAAEILMEDEWLAKRLEQLALANAKECYYSGANDVVICLDNDVAENNDCCEDDDCCSRAEAKQKSRDADERALLSGEKTIEELRKENAAFSFPDAKINLKGNKFPK